MKLLCFAFYSEDLQFHPPSSSCCSGIHRIALFTLGSSPYPKTSRVRIMFPVRHGSSQRTTLPLGCFFFQLVTSAGLGQTKAPFSSWCRSRNFSHVFLRASSGVKPSSPSSIIGQTDAVHFGE